MKKSTHTMIRLGLAIAFLIWAIVALFFYSSLSAALPGTPTFTVTVTATPTATATYNGTPTPTRTLTPTSTATVACSADAYEPNDSFGAAVALALKTPISPNVCANDDYFSFSVSAGEQVISSFSSAPVNSWMYLYKPSGTQAASAYAQAGKDALVYYSAETPGAYVARIHPVSVRNVEPSGYSLLVDVGTPVATPTRTPSPTATSTPACTPDAYETNEAYYQAAEISLATPIAANICPADESDWYKSSITAGQGVTITLYNLPLDYDLYVYDPEGTYLDGSANSGTAIDEIQLLAEQSGYYHVFVAGWGRYSMSPYSLQIIDGPGWATQTPTPTYTATSTPTGTITPSATPTHTPTTQPTATSSSGDLSGFRVFDPYSVADPDFGFVQNWDGPCAYTGDYDFRSPYENATSLTCEDSDRCLYGDDTTQAVRVVPDTDWTVTGIQAYIGQGFNTWHCSPGEEVWVSLYEGENLQIATKLAASASIDCSSIGHEEDWIPGADADFKETFTFDPPVELTQGNTYLVQFAADPTTYAWTPFWVGKDMVYSTDDPYVVKGCFPPEPDWYINVQTYYEYALCLSEYDTLCGQIPIGIQGVESDATPTPTPTRTPSPTFTTTPTRTATPTMTLVPTSTPTGTVRALTAVARTATAAAQKTITAATGTPTPWRTPGTPALFSGDIAVKLVQATPEATSAAPTPWATCVSASFDGESTVRGSFTSYTQAGGGSAAIDNTDFVSGAGSVYKTQLASAGWSRHLWTFPTPWAIDDADPNKSLIIEYDIKMVETPTGSGEWYPLGRLRDGGSLYNTQELYNPAVATPDNWQFQANDDGRTFWSMPDGAWNHVYIYQDQQGFNYSYSTPQPGEVMQYIEINGTPIPTVTPDAGKEGRLYAIPGQVIDNYISYYVEDTAGKFKLDNYSVSLCICENNSCFYTGETEPTATPTITPAPTYIPSVATPTPQPISRAWISEVFPEQGFTCMDWNHRGDCGVNDLYVEWYTGVEVLSGGWVVELENSTCTYTVPADSLTVGWKVAWWDEFRKPEGVDEESGIYCTQADFPTNGEVTLKDATGEILDTRSYFISEIQKGLSWGAYISSYPAGNWGTVYPSPGR